MSPGERQEAGKAFEFASKNFRPLYYTMQYPADKSKIEMSFDLTHYQPQFRGEKPAGPIDPNNTSDHHHEIQPVPQEARNAQNGDLAQEGSSTRTGTGPQCAPELPLEKHVFQTIFLDCDGSSQLWTVDDIDQDKKIYEKWWKQQSHRWQHYAGTVPWMMFINGKNNTQYVITLCSLSLPGSSLHVIASLEHGQVGDLRCCYLIVTNPGPQS